MPLEKDILLFAPPIIAAEEYGCSDRLRWAMHSIEPPKVAEHIHLPLIYGILQNASFCSAPVFLYVLERLSLLGPR